ncbi:MAG TPA: hypothetical protein VFI31_20615 [Pirellulales bacterium]|nr:hypothetical protein [Pirellulales bacterium]
MLAEIAYRLTIAARDTYDDHGDVEDTKRLRSLNEIQHRVLASLRELAAGQRDARMSDDSLVGIFFAERDDKQLSRWLASTFEKAANAIRGAQTLGQSG